MRKLVGAVVLGAIVVVVALTLAGGQLGPSLGNPVPPYIGQ